MNRISIPFTAHACVAAALSALLAATGCASAGAGAGGSAHAPTPTRPYVDADVHFMSGMIPHHAQAIRMAELAPDRTQDPTMLLLAERIIVSQRDEIALMQQWLRHRDLPVPPADATHLTMQHGGMTHEMLMPGMLTEEEFAQLEAARGVEFDRLLLRYMIRHHEGAITMVNELLDTDGAAQDDLIWAFASDVFADQGMEIERMSAMLAARGGD
jgi:uncharacterized protein (DUF305 family)